MPIDKNHWKVQLNINWDFKSEDNDFIIEEKIYATVKDYIGLTYDNPPGDYKNCLNTKIAMGELILVYNLSGKSDDLRTKSRAACEIINFRSAMAGKTEKKLRKTIYIKQLYLYGLILTLSSC